MNFYYIADKRNPNEIEKGNKRNKFYQSKGAVKAQFTARKHALGMSIQVATNNEWKEDLQNKLDNLTIMVVSGTPKELED